MDLQTRLRTIISERGLSFTVLSDYGMPPGPRRSLSADLVIRNAAGHVLVAAELKSCPGAGGRVRFKDSLRREAALDSDLILVAADELYGG